MAKSNNTQKAKTKIQKAIYMDYASSADPNPSSIHAEGVASRKKLETARAQAANVLQARPRQIVFTSGGTESNNLAISGLVWSIFETHAYLSVDKLLFSARRPAKGVLKITRHALPHIITTNIEHPSVLETCKMLEKRGMAEVTIVPVEANGIVDPKKIKKEIKENTVLVSVMYANNEIGTIQPIKEIAKEIRHFKKSGKINFSGHGYFSTEKFLELASPRSLVPNKLIFPLFHTDAVQAANYLDLHVERLGVDLLSLSGSKIEGSAKVGLLYVKDPKNLASLFHGGDQEMGLRPGTENVKDISKFADALEFTQAIKEKETKRLTSLRNYLREKLNKLSATLDIELLVNGDPVNRLPNNMNITIRNIPSDLLVIELSARGVYVSSKSACKSGDGKVSHVIQAIHPDIQETDGSLRFSFGRTTTKSDIDYTVKSLREILTKLKKWYN